MNVNELYGLAEWIRDYVSEVQEKYSALKSVLYHNATQPQKQPLEDQIHALNTTLDQMPFQILSNEQIRLLDEFEISTFVGSAGLEFIRDTIFKSDFDPATANRNVEDAIEKLQQSRNRADAVFQALDGLEPVLAEPEIDDLVLMRVEFKDEASINNVVDWQDWANQWVDISRGITLSFGDAPENVKVVGATRGSIILELAGAYLFVQILAGIAKSLIGVAKSILELRQTAEDLRGKKLLNQKIENELKAAAEEQRANGVDNIFAEVVNQLPNDLDGEQTTALKRSISKLLEFHTKGGQVDFVEPEEIEGETDEDAETPNDNVQMISDLRKSIEEYRSLRDEVSRLELLTHASEEDTENGEE